MLAQNSRKWRRRQIPCVCRISIRLSGRDPLRQGLINPGRISPTIPGTIKKWHIHIERKESGWKGQVPLSLNPPSCWNLQADTSPAPSPRGYTALVGWKYFFEYSHEYFNTITWLFCDLALKLWAVRFSFSVIWSDFRSLKITWFCEIQMPANISLSIFKTRHILLSTTDHASENRKYAGQMCVHRRQNLMAWHYTVCAKAKYSISLLVRRADSAFRRCMSDYTKLI